VVPLDSALIAGNVGLATSNYFFQIAESSHSLPCSVLDIHLLDGTYLLLDFASYEIETFC
jgi:hypothetical protein